MSASTAARRSSFEANPRPRVRLDVEALEQRATPAAADFFAVGTDSGVLDRVKLYDPAGTLIASFRPFGGNFKGGVRVAIGDLDNDGSDELIVGAGAGQPRVKVFRGTDILTEKLAFTGKGAGDLVASFLAFPASFKGGVFVACDDLNSNVGGLDDIIVGAGPGAPPRVKIFDADDIVAEGLAFTGNGDSDLIANFLAYPQSFRGGVRVAAADINVANGFAEVIVAPGPGMAPRVKVFDGNAINTKQLTFTGAAPGDIKASFLAYAASFRGGVWVGASANFNSGDTLDDIIVGPGAGMVPRVKVFSGAEIQADGPAFTGNEIDDLLANFLAFPGRFRGGVRVGAITLGGDDLIIVALDEGPGIISTFLAGPPLTTTFAVIADFLGQKGFFVSS